VEVGWGGGGGEEGAACWLVRGVVDGCRVEEE